MPKKLPGRAKKRAEGETGGVYSPPALPLTDIWVSLPGENEIVNILRGCVWLLPDVFVCHIASLLFSVSHRL